MIDRCPHCDHLLDAATELVDGTEIGAGEMTPGDCSVCFYCGGFLVKRFDLRLWVLSDEDFISLPLHMRSMLLRARAVAKANRRMDS